MKPTSLSKKLLDVLDWLDRSTVRKVSKKLRDSMSLDNKEGDRISLDINDMTLRNLKKVLGDFGTDDEYKKFLDVFDQVHDYVQELKHDKEKLITKDWPESKLELQTSSTDIPVNVEKGSMDFTDDFWMMLDKLPATTEDVYTAIVNLHNNPTINNKLDIEMLDISSKANYFDVVADGRPGKITVYQFINSFYPNQFSSKEINNFLKYYNKLIAKANKSDDLKYTTSTRYGGYTQRKRKTRRSTKPVPKEPFVYKPDNVKSTFLSLVTRTYPHGTEEDVMQFIPEEGLEKDEYGNYYKIIGDSDTMFTSHLDTASRSRDRVTPLLFDKGGDEFVMTDYTSILGADDKAGVAIMLYMMYHNVPGVYVFFIGEERGGIGSDKMATFYHNYPFMKKMKKCVSFDRRNYYSVITSQYGEICCSDEFGKSLCNELNKSGLRYNLDPTGVFTDSANFTELIPECTNVSVGYFNEHSHDEVQNLTFLEHLAEACVNVDWKNLTVKRKIDVDDDVLREYGRLLYDFKKLMLYNDDKIKSNDGKLTIVLEINDYSFGHMAWDMRAISSLFNKHNLDPVITFDKSYIKFNFD